jgi:hypothetical protein
MYNTLIDPPYELAALEILLFETALQSEQLELLTLTLTPATVVAALALWLMDIAELHV